MNARWTAWNRRSSASPSTVVIGPTTADTGGVLWRFLNAHPLASAGGSSAATAKLVSAKVAYKPSRRVLVRVDLGQPSSLKLSLSRRSRTLAKRIVAQAKAGVSSYALSVPRATRPGALTLHVIAQAVSGSQVTVTRSLKLKR